MSAKEILNKIISIMKKEKLEPKILGWLSNSNAKSFKDKNLVISVENSFLKDKILENREDILKLISKYFIDSDNMNIEVEIEKKDEVETLDFNVTNRDNFESTKSRYDSDYDKPNEKYQFENYIVGGNNQFAHAAALSVANSPGKMYNPLFIYGGVGLGKTHLMNAIGNMIMKNNSRAVVHYCSSEQFTNSLINSLKRDKMPQFREKYRKIDALLIDDIQFIAGKDSTQEEFFHTFNTLHQYSRQIVISSDRPPQEIKNIEDRLISRFTWGLIADIKAPDYETRVAILKNKAESDNIEIPLKCIEYIAEAVNSNIRELEGSLNRVVAKASLMGKEIDFDLIQDVFKFFKEDKMKKVSKSKILKSVSQFYNIPISEIESNKRKQDIAKARQVSMYFLRNILDLSFSAIGEAFGGKDHTTVMHSFNKIDSLIAYDPNLKSELEELKGIILK
jgi:chromosomal replication initiator protein